MITSALQFKIGAGTGVIVTALAPTPETTGVESHTKSEVEWGEISNISISGGIASRPITYVAIDSNGDGVQSPNDWTNTQKRQFIPVGVVIHASLVSIEFVAPNVQYVVNPMSHLMDMAKAIGFLNTGGNIMGPATLLTIAKSAGTIFAINARYHTNPDDPSVIIADALNTSVSDVFRYSFQDSTSSAATLTDINPKLLDTGSYPGDPVGIPNNRWSVTRVFLALDNSLVLAPPQTGGAGEYKTADEAFAAVDTEGFIVNPNLTANTILIGYIAILGGATDLNITTDAEFYTAGKFGGSTVSGASGVTLQEAYTASSPASMITTTGKPLIVEAGSGLTTENQLEIKDADSGLTNFSITGDGVATISHTSAEVGASTMFINHSAVGFSDTTAIDVTYVTGAQSGTVEAGVLINIDKTSSIGGNVVGLGVLTTTGTANTFGLYSGAEVKPLVQASGVFTTPSTGTLDINGTPAALGSLSGVNLWVANTDYIIISNTAKFSEVAFDLAVVASGAGIKPTFEYSTGAGPSWAAFNPTDGTNGMRTSGVISWQLSDIPSWAVDASNFQIRINRSQNSLSTIPQLNDNGLYVAVVTAYGWDEAGEITSRRINVEDIELNVPTMTVKNTDTVSGSMTGVIEMRDNADALAVDMTLASGNLTLTNNVASGDTILATASRTLTLDETANALLPSSTTMNLGSGTFPFAVGQFSDHVKANKLDNYAADPLLIGPTTATAVDIAGTTILTRAMGPLTSVEAFIASTTSNLIGVTTIGTGATDYVLPTTRGTDTQVLTTNGSGVASWADATGGGYTRYLSAGDFENPTNGNWSVDGLAPLITNPGSNSILVRAFDSASEEGVGWTDVIPAGFSSITLRYVTRAATGPPIGPDVAASMTLHYRQIPDGAALPSWTERDIAALDYTFGNGEQWVHDTETFTFASFSPNLTADSVYQFQLTRDAANGSDTLDADMYLMSLTVTYS